MNNATQNSNIPISLAVTDSDSGIKVTVTNEVAKQAAEHINKIIKYFFMVVLGAILAVIWNLNGQIYQAVGATGVSTKALEIEINRLRDEIKNLQKQSDLKDCITNKQVTDKAGCYRGN